MEYNTFIFCIVRYIPASCSVYHRLSVLHYVLIGEGMYFPYSHQFCFFSVVFCSGDIFYIHIPNIQNPYIRPCPRQSRFGFCVCRLLRSGRRACWSDFLVIFSDFSMILFGFLCDFFWISPQVWLLHLSSLFGWAAGLVIGGSSSWLVTAGRLSLGYHQPNCHHLTLLPMQPCIPRQPLLSESKRRKTVECSCS